MSGTAALSAARRRRASSVATPGQGPTAGTPVSYSNTPNPYYNSGQQQQQQQGRGMPGGVSLIPQNMTIHENIELIKTQMDQRLQLINSKGRSMPPDKLKTLQKQQEIQMQILKQKIAIAQEMDDEYDNQAPHFPQQQMQQQQQQQQQQPQPKVEPPIIYDRGIPRPNPKYVAPIPNDVAAAAAAAAQPVNIQQQTHTPTQKPQAAPQAHKQPHQSNRSVMPTATLSPFVSMTSAGGAIPPPIVILKSHDDKIGEHDAVLNDLTNRVNYIHSRIEQVERNGSLQQQQQQQEPMKQSQTNDSNKGQVRFEQKQGPNGEDENDNETDEGDEPMILMTEVISDLLDSREFMQGIVDKIMNETNLSEVIFKIDPIIKENQELRALIHSQQETLNQMNTMILKFLNTQAQIMLSNESNSNNVQREVSVVDEIQDVITDCNEDGLYEDWQNSVDTQAQVQVQEQVQEQDLEQQEQDHEQQEQDHEPEQEQQEQEEQQEEQQEQQEQQEQVQCEPEQEHEQQEHEQQEQEEKQQESQEKEQEEQLNNEVDTTSDNEAPSFPDMDRLKLLVSEIPASDM